MIFRDKKMLDAIQDLKEKVVLLAPDKGNGVVVMDKEDYRNSLEQLFSDRTKFRVLKEDPTNTRLKSLQTFLRSSKSVAKSTRQNSRRCSPKMPKLVEHMVQRRYIRISTGFHH